MLVTIGQSCALKLGLGLGLGLGIPCVGCIIVIVILVKKEVKIQNKDELEQFMPESPVMSITAFVHGLFIQRVQWHGPIGNILTSNGKYNIKYDKVTGISTLQILALAVNDSGLYTCCAIGLFGQSVHDSVSIKVYATAQVKKLEVNIQNKDELQKEIQEGRVMSITASVHGFCIKIVQWHGPHRNILTSNGKYNIKYDQKTGISTLQILALEINDSGLYTCRAIGKFGSTGEDSVLITVYENLAVDIDIGQTGQHGSDVKIICSVYGSENKSVDWTGQEENILTNDGRYTIAPYDSNTSKSCLTISTSSMTNAEGYICQVEFKKSGVSVKIYITSDNGSLTYSIEKILLFVPASENERREWIGPQENILTDTGKYAIVPYDSNTNKSHLTVKTFFEIDNGSYTCQPRNSSGTSPTYSVKITTNVLEPPQAPGFKKPPENREIKSGSGAAVSREHVQIQVERQGVKSDEEERLLPMQLDIPKHRLQPTSPENSDVEDQNLRVIHVSANFDDSQVLPTYIPESSRLPPLPQKQPTVQEEASSKKPKKKQNKKKKGKVNEGNPEEIVELNRNLSEDQSDED